MNEDRLQTDVLIIGEGPLAASGNSSIWPAALGQVGLNLPAEQ